MALAAGDLADEGFDASEVAMHTWLPALATTAIGMSAAVVGGFAIGAVRPLGGGTRWLLLLFAPWLFVGSGPLAVANYEALVHSGGVGGFLAAMPRAWIAVPALFVLTALFWGLEDRRRAMTAQGMPASRANGAFAAQAASMVVLVGMFVWIANGQDAIWQWTAVDPDRPTAALVLSQMINTFNTGYGSPVPLLVLFVAVMVLASVFYPTRVGIRIGR